MEAVSSIAMTDDVVSLSKGYPVYLEALKPLLEGQPDVTIVAKDCSLSSPVPVVERSIPTLPGHIVNVFTSLCRRKKVKEFYLVKDANVVIRPGTMTLVLAPPGHGKTALLKVLSGRKEPTYGSVTFNGKNRHEAATAGLRHDKVTQYVDQVDVHLPLLTVRETFQFAVNHGCVDPQEMDQMSAAQREQLQLVYNTKVDTVLKLLGLEECADTMVGNELMRGVSGGQRKRVTLGEVMLNDSRVLLLDEITNGLDAATAVDIFRSLRQWCDVMNGSVVSSPLQPTPEMFELFDNVILMREGHIVYNGPRTDVIPYFEALGIRCPPDQDYADFLVEFLSQPRVVMQRQLEREAKSALESKQQPEVSQAKRSEEAVVPVSVSVSAEEEPESPKVVRFSGSMDGNDLQVPASQQVSNPNSPLPSEPSLDSEAIRVHYYKENNWMPAESSNALQNIELAVLGRSSSARSSGSTSSRADPNPYFSAQALASVTSSGAPLTTPSLSQAFNVSRMGQALEEATSPQKVAATMANDPKAMPKGQWATRQYGSEFVHSFWRHSAYNLKRQAVLTKRNKGLIMPRIFQSIWLGVVLGTLFYQTDMANFGGRLGLIIFACTTMAFANMVEIPSTSAASAWCTSIRTTGCSRPRALCCRRCCCIYRWPSPRPSSLAPLSIG